MGRYVLVYEAAPSGIILLGLTLGLAPGPHTPSSVSFHLGKVLVSEVTSGDKAQAISILKLPRYVLVVRLPTTRGLT